MTEDFRDLYAHAQDTHAVVVGGGIGGLVAALECAKVGIRVTVLEAAEEPGGAIRSADVDGLTLDLGAESFATRGGKVRSLIDELGLADAVVDPGTGAGGAWLAGLPRGAAAPLPKGGVLGIPANPFADDVRRIIGWGGAWRAYLDRLRPPLTIGHAHSLGRLVRSRLGEKVLDRLVAPVTSGVYSARPDDIDPEVAAPGLNAALTRAGSLTGAVALLQGERRKVPGAAVQGIDGGMGRLVSALVTELGELGAEVRCGARVERIRGAGDGWEVVLEVDAAQASEEKADLAAADGVSVAGEPGAWPGEAAGVSTGSLHEAPQSAAGADASSEPPAETAIPADIVIVATEESTARGLLADVVPGLDPQPARPGPVVHIASLVVDAPELDDAPRGTGVLTVPGTHRAKALTHSTAKWPWLKDRAGSGRHVLRVSFGAQAEPPATEGLEPGEQTALALQEASALVGVELNGDRLRGARVEAFAQAQPASIAGHAERTARARDAIRKTSRIGAVGAWLSGTGLAQVIPDARDEAERLRRAVLFG